MVMTLPQFRMTAFGNFRVMYFKVDDAGELITVFLCAPRIDGESLRGGAACQLRARPSR
jgi:hypothetical protein